MQTLGKAGTFYGINAPPALFFYRKDEAMFLASAKFFELTQKPEISADQYEYYEAMRMLAVNIEAIHREVEEIKQRVYQLPQN